jgi:hypothetical protein
MTFLLFLMALSGNITTNLVNEYAIAEPKYNIESIVILGNERTRRGIILREITFSLGDSLTLDLLEKEVERSRRNIYNTNLFVYCKADFDIENGKANVFIEVKERLYLLPLPILFLADRSFNEWWYNRNHDFKRLIYGVQLNHTNLTGNGDFLKLKAYGGFVPYFELSYGRPYIDKRQRMGLRGGLFYSNQKSFAYRTWNDKLDFVESEEVMKDRKGIFVEYNLRNVLYHAHKIYLGYTESKLSERAVELNPNFFETAGRFLPYFTFKYNYRYEKVNNVQYPLDGKIIAASLINYGMGASKHVNHTAIGFEYHDFIPLGKKFFVNFGFKGQVSAPKRQLYQFVSAFGPRNILVRGYEVNVVDGQHYGLLRSNLKYELSNNIFDISKVLKIKQFNSLPIAIYPNIYGDLGYVKNYFPELSNSTLANKFLYGGGIGVDLVTFYDTAVKVNYSVNQTGFGKFYFGVQRGI